MLSNERCKAKQVFIAAHNSEFFHLLGIWLRKTGDGFRSADMIGRTEAGEARFLAGRGLPAFLPKIRLAVSRDLRPIRAAIPRRVQAPEIRGCPNVDRSLRCRQIPTLRIREGSAMTSKIETCHCPAPPPEPRFVERE